MAGHASRENGKKGGRPKGSKTASTLSKEAAREVLRAMVIAQLAPMTDAQIAAAKGVQHFVLRQKDGKFKKVESAEAAIAALEDPEAVWEFWSRDPSTQAYMDLMNRALDKPAEQVKVTGDDGGPVRHIFSWKK